MYKFRSMTVGAEKSGVYSDKHDARVTKVGKIIRATSIDEQSQLVNIPLAIPKSALKVSEFAAL